MYLAFLIWLVRKANLLRSIFGTIIGQVANGDVVLAIVGVESNMLQKPE